MNSFQAQNGVDHQQWLIRFNQVSRPKLRLFCFPYAGGNANVFRNWATLMPACVEVFGVQYPGRGGNSQLPAIDCCDQLVEKLLQVLLPWLDGDFVLFGHSNGALISFEFARKLPPDKRSYLQHLFLSARAAAHLPKNKNNISHLSTVEFIQEIRAMGGTPQELLEDQRLMEFIVPRLRADFALGEHYSFLPGPSLACNITTLFGREDLYVNREHVIRWAELTSGRAQHFDFPGDHFFLNSQQDDVLQLLHGTMQQLI